MSFAELVLLAWIPISAALFALFRPARALVLAYLVGWLLLPMARLQIEGFWDINKTLATNMGVVTGLFLFCPRTLKGYRVGPADVGILVFAVVTGIASMLNGLGAYDGLSSVVQQIFYYAIPFCLGRAVLRTPRHLLDASRLIITGAALYAVLAVWEWRMSPRIHRTLYGYFQHGFSQHMRWGRYRPILCFPHALGLGSFMAWTSLLGIWLHRARQLPPLFGVPSTAIVLLPLLGLAASMSFGPWGLFLAGFSLLLLWRWTGRRWLFLLPAFFTLLWMSGRYTTLVDGQWLTSAVAKVSTERASSLQYRIDAEARLLDHARERPVFGWGTRARDPFRNDAGRFLFATDGLWTIFLSFYGLAGLLSFYLWWCWPLLVSTRPNRRTVLDAAVEASLVAIGMQAVNFLFNGFLSPVLTLICGAAVSSLETSRGETDTCRPTLPGLPPSRSPSALPIPTP
ncbi:MAG: O-antigen ligase family protein [Phycisphaerales bacterium]|nr:MAG: O-antigen ligase family protein [Phycisphaerales bacterium]